MKAFYRLNRADMKKVMAGVFGGCDGKPSTTYCRDANDNELGSVDGTGCAHFMNNCTKYPNAVAGTSTCSCSVS